LQLFIYTFLAQADDAPPFPAPASQPRRMNFGDLQKGFHQFNSGDSDPSVRNGLLLIVGLIILIGIAFHIRSRLKARKTPDSEAKLFRELASVVHIPIFTRLALKWVARSTKVHAAVLLISEQAFIASVAKWQNQPTFTPLRRWAKKRLTTLRPRLFGS
jgi:hypothetical protein